MRSKSGRVRTWEWTFAGDFSAFFCSLDHIAWRSVLAGCANHAGKKKWSEIRKTALSRDGYRCRIPACGQTQELTVHHIHPRGLGGGDLLANLVTLCESCHQSLCDYCLRPLHLRIPFGDAATNFPESLSLQNVVLLNTGECTLGRVD